MARSIPALVKPALLVWARESAGLCLEEAAVKTEVEPETLTRWEAGEQRPTIPQVRKLGEVYKRPLAVFFLPEPPTTFMAQREFRRLPGIVPQHESPDLRLALRTALFRREAALELYEELGERPVEFTAVTRPQTDPESVGQRIRNLLGVTWSAQLNWVSDYAALDGWRSTIERQGVLVFQTGKVELSEMRGTSTLHGPLPIILLNNADAPHGRIFTLLHEFAHLMLANGGYSTNPTEAQRLPEERRLERISNRIAAATLLPRTEFLAEAARFPGALAGEEDSLRRLASRVRVSAEAILRRLVTLQQVSKNIYGHKRREWHNRPRNKPEKSSSGGPPLEVRVVSSAGRPFVSLVLDGYQRNAVSSASVSDYLGVQLKYLDKVARQLAPGPGAGTPR